MELRGTDGTYSDRIPDLGTIPFLDISQCKGNPGGTRDSLRACRTGKFPKQESTTYRQATICKLLILRSRKSISDRLLIRALFLLTATRGSPLPVLGLMVLV